MKQVKVPPETTAGRLEPGALFRKGVIAGVPIGMGYFVVAFSLGIAAKRAGISVFQGFIASLITYTSTGEYAVFTQIGAKAALLEVAIMTLVINARYLLMSCALGQRMAPGSTLRTRLLAGMCITDEIFGITIAQEGFIHPIYSLGALSFAAPCWALGTAFGIRMGEILPLFLVSALSVALYGMFIAVIVPAGKKSRPVLLTILACFVLSTLAARCPGIRELSAGTRTILLTIGISSAAAILAPVKEENA